MGDAMPERDTDNNRSWVIPTVYPGADYRLNQAAVSSPQLVEAIGTDGRFVGAIRPFPGFADDTVHKVPHPESGRTISSIANIFFVKYASIQKGLTSDKLSGIVLLGDNQEEPVTGKAIYFAYYDTSDDSYDVVMLEDFKDWDDFTLDTFTEYDVTSHGQYIYFVASGDTTAVDDNYSTKEPPYNRAYFWDWKINSWDKYNSGFNVRMLGIASPRFLKTPINLSRDVFRVGGIAAAITLGSTTVTLTTDAPDLSGVVPGDYIYLHQGEDDLEVQISTVDNVTKVIVLVGSSGIWTSTTAEWRIIKEDGTESSDAFVAYVQTGGPFTMPKGNYTFGLELISRKHRLRSSLRMYTLFATEVANTYIALRVYYLGETYTSHGGDPSQHYDTRGGGHTGEAGTAILHWGIPHTDGFRIWRSPGDGAEAAGGREKYDPVGQLYLTDPYIEKVLRADPASEYAQGSRMFIDHSTTRGASPRMGHRSPYLWDGVTASNVEKVGALQARPAYQPWDDSFGPAPRMKRLAAYSGLLLGITDIAVPTDFQNWDEVQDRPEELCWSHTGRSEPENFPVFNRYALDGAGETFLGLEPAGDHLFALTGGSVYKVLRSGSIISLNRVLSGVGVVNRFAAIGVGNTLFLVTKAGVKSIDGNSGAIKSISALDRIIINDGEWNDSLDAIHLEYDATIGALVFLNTTKHECIFLWESTGAITRLVDAPWSFLAAGPDVATSGAPRVYFVMDDGNIHTIDADREMGKRSMCGTGAAETVNGTCTTASITQIIDSGATFPANCVGHKVYILNGTDEGVATTVTARNSDTTLTVSGLTEATTTDTRYAVASIVTELVFPQLVGYRGEHDPFTRKIVKSISAAFSDLSGETDPDSDDNAVLRFGVWRDGSRLVETEADLNILPDKCLAQVSCGDARVYPSLRFLSGNIDFELQALMVEGIISGNVAQSRIT